jgi:esterase/lipase
LPNVSLPVLVLQGSQDKLVVPKGAQTIYDNVGSADKQVAIYRKSVWAKICAGQC